MSDTTKLSEVAAEPNPHAIACAQDLLDLAKEGVVIGIYGCIISPGNVVQPVRAGSWNDPTLALALHDLHEDFGTLRRLARKESLD